MEMIVMWIPMVLILLWNWSEAREDERRRTQPERNRRRMRDLEHRLLVKMGAERILRRMLIEDRRQIAQRHEAAEYLREHYGIETQWPSSSASTGRSIRERFGRRWAAR